MSDEAPKQPFPNSTFTPSAQQPNALPAAGSISITGGGPAGKGLSAGPVPPVSAKGPDDLLGTLLDLANKPGWKSTEAWLTLIVVMLLQWAVFAGKVNGTVGEVAAVAVSMYYSTVRKDHKGDMVGELAEMAQTAVPQLAAGKVIDVEAEVARVLPQILAAQQSAGTSAK